MDEGWWNHHQLWWLCVSFASGSSGLWYKLKNGSFLLLHRFIDHGNGTLTLRIQDPFVFDSGRYSCTITTPVGDCTTHCDVDIDETFDNLLEVIPEFIKPPLPTVALPGTAASFCTRFTPVDSDVIWSVCGREITDDTKDYAVSVRCPIQSAENIKMLRLTPPSRAPPININ